MLAARGAAVRLPFPAIDSLFDPVLRGGFVPPSPHPEGDPPQPPPKRCFAHPLELAVCMQEAGVQQALVTQCRVWNCERQYLCAESRADDVLKFVRESPERFVGLAGFNPYKIAESLKEIDECAAGGGFRGIYVNAETFAVSLADRKIYPLYAKAGELGWPVVIQFSASAQKIEPRPATLADLLDVSHDLPELTLVAALRAWPATTLLESIAAKSENVFFAIPATLIKACSDLPLIMKTVGDRLLWCSDGRSWRAALEELTAKGLDDLALRRFVHDNAARVFHLHGAMKVKAAAAGEPLAAER